MGNFPSLSFDWFPAQSLVPRGLGVSINGLLSCTPTPTEALELEPLLRSPPMGRAAISARLA